MNDAMPLSSELQTMIDEFSRIRDAYVGLRAYCDIQEDTLDMERSHSSRMKENFEKLSKTYTLLEKRYRSMIEEFKNEKLSLQRTIENLKEQCDHFRVVITDHNGDNEQVYKLENEIEALKSAMLVQTTKHNEEIAILKQKHSDELLRYKMLLQNAKLGAATNGVKRKGRPTKPVNEDTNFSRWPELSIERICNSAPIDAEENAIPVTTVSKKRRLFNEENDDLIDIVQTGNCSKR